MKARRVVIKGSRFVVARKLADAGIPFTFDREAGVNTVGYVSTAHLPALSTYLGAHPEMEGRYDRHEQGDDARAAYYARSLRIGG